MDAGSIGVLIAVSELKTYLKLFIDVGQRNADCTRLIQDKVKVAYEVLALRYVEHDIYLNMGY